MAEEMLDIALIKISGGTQSRVGIDHAVVEEYNEAMQNGAVFPPVEVYHDGKDYWLADGFHRYWAACKASLRAIKALIHQGTRRDAILHSVGANASHGLRRTNADKHRAVEVLLKDEEWAQWSDREIARRCGVDHKFVGKIRKDVTGDIPSEKHTYTTKHGTTAKMQTNGVGRTTAEIPSLDAELAKSRKERQEISKGDFLVGDKVRTANNLTTGTIADLTDSQATVDWGTYSLDVSFDNLRPAPTNPAPLIPHIPSLPSPIQASIEKMLPEMDHKTSAIAADVEAALPEILLNSERDWTSEEYMPSSDHDGDEDELESFMPYTLYAASNSEEIDYLIDKLGAREVAKQFVEGEPELKAEVRGYYPGMDAIVRAELGEHLNHADPITPVETTSAHKIVFEEEPTKCPECKAELPEQPYGPLACIECGWEDDEILPQAEKHNYGEYGFSVAEYQALKKELEEAKKLLGRAENKIIELSEQLTQTRKKLDECRESNKSTLVGCQVIVVSESSKHCNKIGTALSATVKQHKTSEEIEIVYSVQLNGAEMKNSFLEEELKKVEHE